MRVLLASAASRKALAIAKSLKSLLGAQVVAALHTDHPYIYSRHFDRRLLLPLPRSSKAWALAVLRAALKERCDAVLPVDFVDVATLAEHRGVFERAGVVLVAPPSESVKLAADKGRLPELLAGVARTPKQVVFDVDADLEGLSPPLVVKGLGDASNPSYHLTRGSALAEARRRGRCLVQEYVAGVGRGYYAVASGGEPLLEFTHERLVERDPSGGASMAARGPVRDPRLYAIGRAVLAKLRWTGPLMVETRFNSEEGYFVVELNPKFWGSLDLPVSLSYHFPAVLVKASLEGPEGARVLARSLLVREGGFSWVLDGFRYLAKVPSAWVKLARLAARRGFSSDVELGDPARVAAQLATALTRLGRERGRWLEQLTASATELGSWAAMLSNALEKRERVLALDLDGVIVDLRADWRAAKKELVERDLARKWESVSEAFARLWREDREAYERASGIVERYERAALAGSRALLSAELLSELARHFELYVTTMQPAGVALEALELLGARELARGILGRDSGVGPLKREMYSELARRHRGAGALVVDDRLENLVEGLRLGAVPLHSSRDAYRAAQASRLGMPSAPPDELLKLLASTIRHRLGG